MNTSESNLFKVLMWTITTLMGIVTVGVIAILQIVVTIKIDFDQHSIAQTKQESYYVSRLYNDSININTLFRYVGEHRQLLKQIDPEEFEIITNESLEPLINKKFEAVLPKKKLKYLNK